jgi:hypothetical protein
VPAFAEPGPCFPNSRVRAAREKDPARLPRTRLAARSWANFARRTPSSRDLPKAFRPSPVRSTLAAPRALADPVRSGGSSRSLAVTSSYRLAAFLGRADKMPRIRFYNRRSRHEHPPETPISETARRAPWETRRRSTSRPLFVPWLSPRRSSGAGPPRGHPTSDGHTLDGVPAGFGPVSNLYSRGLFRLRAARLCRVGGEAPGRCLPAAPLPTRPSDTSCRRLNRDPRCLKARLCSLRLTPLLPEHVNAADFHRVEVPSIVGDRRRSPFEPRRGVLFPAGRPGQVPHVFIVVQGPRLDPCSYALRVRLQGRVRSHDFCNRCFHEHDHGPLRTSRRPETVVGTTAILRRKSPFDWQSPKLHEVRGRGTPCLGAPHRDCSR